MGTPPRPTTGRLGTVGGLALHASVQFGPGWAAASPASSAGPLSVLDGRPCTNTRYFSLRLMSAYPCHKLSPTSTEGFQACVCREVSALPGTGKGGLLTSSGETKMDSHTGTHGKREVQTRCALGHSLTQRTLGKSSLWVRPTLKASDAQRTHRAEGRITP